MQLNIDADLVAYRCAATVTENESLMKPYLISNFITYNLTDLTQVTSEYDPVNVVLLSEEVAHHIQRLISAQNTLTDTIQGLLNSGEDFPE